MNISAYCNFEPIMKDPSRLIQKATHIKDNLKYVIKSIPIHKQSDVS